MASSRNYMQASMLHLDVLQRDPRVRHRLGRYRQLVEQLRIYSGLLLDEERRVPH